MKININIKKKIYIYSIFLVIIIIGIAFLNDFKKRQLQINGHDIYNDLQLNECNKLYIMSNQYVHDGKLKGEKNLYKYMRGDKSLINILKLIKNTKNNSIKIVNYRPGVFDTVTHQLQFNNTIQVEYSIISNKIMITDTEFSSKLIKSSTFSSKAIIINMNYQFKKIISTLK